MQARLFFAVIAFVCFAVVGSYTKAQQSQQETTSADDLTAIQQKYPILVWQGSKADSGQLLKGRVESPNLEIIKDKLVQLDWSGEASTQPCLGICLDRYNLLRIELAAAEKGKKSAMVAMLRTAPFMKSGETSDKAVFFMNTPSRPLKDNGHVLELLRSYLKLHPKQDRELDSLTEWDTTDGKLQSPYLRR